MATLYVALLRGINVGGNNIIRMADLKRAFEAADFGRVSTYIQTGNVLFSTPEKDVVDIATRIESTLSRRFGYDSRVVVVSRPQLQHVVARAPAGFGTRPAVFRYDVVFFRPPLRPAAALEQVPVKDGVDHVEAGKYVLYVSRLIARAAQSRVSKVVSLPIYREMTTRNWNTTTKLLALMSSP